MSFPRCLMQLMGERSQVAQCSLEPKRIRPVFQWLTENYVCEFESSQPSHGVRSRAGLFRRWTPAKRPADAPAKLRDLIRDRPADRKAERPALHLEAFRGVLQVDDYRRRGHRAGSLLGRTEAGTAKVYPRELARAARTARPVRNNEDLV